jgi:HK97 family phage portal protein
MIAPFKGLAKAIGFSREETKFVTLTDPLASELFGAIPTVSGASVTSFSALRVPAVLHAVRLIAENCGSTPVKIYRDADDGKEAAKDHPAYRIVHRSANEWTSAVEFRTLLTVDALMHGGGFARVVRYGDGRPFELHRLEPGKVSVLVNTVTGEPVYRVSDARGQVDYGYTDILYLPAFAGTSPISFGKEAIGIAMILEQHMARLFGSGAMPNSLIYNEGKTPANENGEKTIANIRKGFRNFRANNSTDPLILDGGWKYEQIALSSTDAQFLEHRLEQINEIARLFGVPPHMLVQLDRATWANSEEMSRSFLQLCLRPWLDRWQDAYNRVLFTEDERDTHYCEFVIDDLQRADSAGRAEIFSKLISSRVLTPNEARATMNLAPRDGGDELANPFTTTTPAAREPEPAPAPAPAPGEE